MLEKIMKIGEREGFDVEVYYVEGESSSIELDGKSVDTSEYYKSYGIGVRVLKDNKVGFAYSNKLDESIVYKAMKNLVYDEYVSFSYPDKYKNPKIFSKDVENLDETDLMEYLIEMRDLAIEKGAEVLSGSVDKEIGYFRLINSNGVDVEETSTSFSAGISIMLDNEPSHEYKTSIKLFDTKQLTEKALKLAELSKNGVKIKYKGNIVLSPRALRSLLGYTLIPAFSAENVQRNRSYLKGKLGEEIFNNSITIVDDGTIDYGLASGKVDGEGTKTQRTVLVENGILKNYLYDIKRANKEGKESTGNGLRSYSSIPHVGTTNIIIESSKYSLNDFDEYIYINNVIGAHTSNPITGDFSVEIQNSYLYKNGEITPIKKGLFGGNIFELFKEAIPLNDIEQRGKLIAPSILFNGEIIS
ncbi:TldD/PmbA family protein [Methanocaldococcus indicus]|uniref:TldD/PmbA family protein n=1 Tax=Methanocaldococcus indicus TaxID=213231 RepID=UPI003C6D67FD